MNILFYFLSIDSTSGGIYHYGLALLNILKLDRENSYWLYCKPNSEIDSIISTSENIHYVKLEFVEKKKFKSRLNAFKGLVNTASKRLGFSKVFNLKSNFELVVDKYQIDLLYSPHQYLPPTSKPCIVTLHDVQELHFPEFFSAEERAGRAVSYLKALRQASAVVVSYQHIKEDLIKYFQTPDESIHVILLDMVNLWFNRVRESAEGGTERLEIPNNFILYPAATWPHKNHLKLVEAVGLLKSKGTIVNLICTGHLTSHYDTIKQVVIKHKLENQVYFLGVVNEVTLLKLYKSSLGVVVPTLYEAGSFPLMESLLMGIPVVCSDVTSLPETIGREEFTFNPCDENDIAVKIDLLSNSPDFRKRNQDNCRVMSQRLVNTDSLSKIRGVISRVKEGRQIK
jgi:glycosyltransferase involved in cell wall biosynthesis